MILVATLIIILSAYLSTLPTLFKIPTANAVSIVRARPNIPEYLHMEDYIQKQSTNQAYSATKRPDEALEDAAANFARALKW